MELTKNDQQPGTESATGAVGASAEKPVKNKKSVQKGGRSTAAIAMEGFGSLVFGGTIVLAILGIMFGPAFVNELREDEIMSVLDMSDAELADTPTGELIDIRKYAEEYKSSDSINQRAAERVERILDEAIEDRIK